MLAKGANFQKNIKREYLLVDVNGGLRIKTESFLKSIKGKYPKVIKDLHPKPTKTKMSKCSLYNVLT